jgi:hypothetical protein
MADCFCRTQRGVNVAPLICTSYDFFFSFSNDDVHNPGGSSGAVTGEIFGPTNNATSSPTDVVILSYPAGFTGAPPPPFSVPVWINSVTGPKQFGPPNTFAVVNDVIVGGSYLASVTETATGITDTFQINGSDGTNDFAVNLPTDQGCMRCVLDHYGLAGVTFTLAPDPSPAPGPIPGAGLLSYIALGILGLGSIGWKRLRMRRCL